MLTALELRMTGQSQDTMVQGIQRVLDEAGQYAFLIEGKSAEWAMGQHCGLVTVGGNINIRNYGIAVKQGQATGTGVQDCDVYNETPWQGLP